MIIFIKWSLLQLWNFWPFLLANELHILNLDSENTNNEVDKRRVLVRPKRDSVFVFEALGENKRSRINKHLFADEIFDEYFIWCYLISSFFAIKHVFLNAIAVYV